MEGKLHKKIEYSHPPVAWKDRNKLVFTKHCFTYQPLPEKQGGYVHLTMKMPKGKFKSHSDTNPQSSPNQLHSTTQAVLYLWTWPAHANASCQGQDRPLELLPTVSYLDNILTWTWCLLWPQTIYFSFSKHRFGYLSANNTPFDHKGIHWHAKVVS